MVHWVRFEYRGTVGFGTVADGIVSIHEGDMFNSPESTGKQVKLADVKILTPTEPTKMIALWNNFRMLAEKLGLSRPPEPLYLLKGGNSFFPHGQNIRKPLSYDGKVVFEGELGIVIGQRLSNVSEAQAEAGIFGYTVINDVTAAEIINRDSSFAQWVRAKSYDTFGVFGPVIASGIKPDALTVRTVLNGEERQNYPVSDMVFPPVKLVSLLSHDMTLLPGDVIACGTNVGVGSMKPGSLVEVTIDSIGTLSNTYAA
ncbi:MAG: fumarylacetoacetate hydrolase family protein [Proteobacteria bacterium]|nr:fumarylacetoacetate hydrolase family protein [Pseudomonadota bacterium]MDE3207863.1 fumarylacetoacetate hydrolase family protein [Pseudomonadota bacterium]